MSDLKNSALLERILELAKQLAPQVKPELSAEKILVALFDVLVQEGAAGEELNQVQQAVQQYQINIQAARNILVEAMQAPKTSTMMDSLYVQRKVYDAKLLAQKNGAQELTADLLLVSILSDPCASVEEILPGAKKTGTADVIGKAAEQDKTASLLQSLLGDKKKKPEDLAGTIAEITEKTPEKSANPKGDMAALVQEVKRIRTELQSSVFGQDNAINTFATGYFQARLLSMIERSRKRPQATFLFAGPPGVGKTFLAEKTAEVLGLPFKRFDMSEYADKEANLEFCGADKVYKNAKPGNVTGFVDKNPRCVLLFDEIEKAHICVIHLFLQMLDAGRLRDNHTDREVSFKDAIIILTTNAGKQLYQESDTGDFSAVPRKVIIKALEKDVNPETNVPYFPGAICSRFASGNVVMFNHIGAHFLRAIAKKEIERHATNLEQETGVAIQVDEKVYTALLFAEGSAADARTVRSRAETFFNDELYELLRLIASEKVKTGIEELEKIKITLDLTTATKNVRSLFEALEKPRVLVLAGEDAVAACREKAPSMEILGAQDVPGAVEILKSHNIDLIVLDMLFGIREEQDTLNIEDVDSPARDFFKFLREQRKDTPTYLLEDKGNQLTEEEKTSFLRQGVRGVLRLAGGKEGLDKQLTDIASALHQQASMIRLARENKLVTFETAQTVSKNGKLAQIKLFDFQMAVAVDSEDAKSVLSAVSKPNVHFDDVIGAGDAKKELTYFVEYLRNPKKYMGTGVKAPKGVLLYGPPGTGKTMLAKAMACEAGVTFLAAEGNQFLKKYVGEGSEKVHELFKTARKYAPSILFIDEIDAIAKERRGAGVGGAGGEETLTAFLTEMDGFTSDPSKPVFVLAATNFDVEPGRAKSLDPALMRRFDRRVYIDLPNKADRIRFLKMKIAKNPALAISQEQIDNISLRATGMSLAELDSVVELALRSAIRDGSTKVTDGIFEEAFETFNGGEIKKWDVSQLERVARHEAGHAFLCWQAGQTPSYITVVARGNHGGYMQHAEQEGKAIYTRDELLARIRTSLGGRAAELVYYGPKDGVSTGASGDLASATQVAQQILCAYGMDEKFGLATVGGEALATEIRAAVNQILADQMAQAVDLISRNRDKIDALVEELMTQNHLNGAQIEKCFGK